MISDSQLKQLVEAAIFAAEEPVTLDELLGGVLAEFSLNKPRLRQVLDALQDDYKERGVELVEVASGYRFQTRPELGPALAHMWPERAPRYSPALLETLALIAWQQPVTRGEIEKVRGVSVSTQIMKTLQERGWVRVVGHKEVPGRPALYATTKAFLDYFSLQTVADIPSLAQPRPELESSADSASSPESGDQLGSDELDFADDNNEHDHDDHAHDEHDIEEQDSNINTDTRERDTEEENIRETD